MRLKLGSHTFDLGQVALSIVRDVEENDAGQPLSIRHRWTLNGLLTTQERTAAAAAADIDSQVEDLDDAAVNGNDVVLTMPDGSTHSQHKLLNSQCLGGTRIVASSIPTFERAGGITNLPFTLTIEGDVPVADTTGLLRSFEESIQFSGGGPLYGHIVVQAGRPVKQLLRRNTVYRAVQTGSAVGYSARPTAPLPLWSNAQVKEGDFTLRSPRHRNGDYIDFFVSWSYEFESATPLIGTPNVWR